MKFDYLRVDDFVSAKRARLAEPLPADFAHEGPRSGVHWHVSGQIIMGIEHLQSELNHRLYVEEDDFTPAFPTVQPIPIVISFRDH